MKLDKVTWHEALVGSEDNNFKNDNNLQVWSSLESVLTVSFGQSLEVTC